MRPVIMLTDFGQADDFAGVCHGVVLARAPGVQVVHLTHGITSHHVVQGALVLRNTLRYMPVGVHMAVVDPGVGTTRRAVAVDCADGRSFVGPDNGLLSPAIERSGGAVAVASIESPDIVLQPVSATFHGRDVFAPAAAHLAGGGAVSDLGPAVPADSLVRLEIPVAQATHDGLIGEVWNVDRFGNVALHLDEETLRAYTGEANHIEITVRNDQFYATVAKTFGHVSRGEILLYLDPYGSVSLAINQGSAAEMFGLRPGDTVLLSNTTVGNGTDPGHVVRSMSPRSR